MLSIQMEPITIRPSHHAHQQAIPIHPGGASVIVNVESLVQQIQQEFPTAHIRITGRGRTVRRQAELMADRRRANRQQFLHTYVHAHHITEMDAWVAANPTATPNETTDAFERIIVAARSRGATVSNHLSDRARDISIPFGGHDVQQEIRNRFQTLGAHVIDEHDAVGGAHWHVDY